MDYLFTWTTLSFFSRDKDGVIRELSSKAEELLPTETWEKTVRNAGTWVKEDS